MQLPITINIPDMIQFAILLVINITSILILTRGMYYPRHHDRDGFVTYTLFNIFLFIIIYFLSKLDIGMTVGFAIFGILGLIRLRSTTFAKIDITYFIGALAIAIINALTTDTYVMLILVNMVILLVTKIIDSKTFLKKPYIKIEYTLDEIPPTLFTNKRDTIIHLESILHVDIIDYKVDSVNAIKDSATLMISYEEAEIQ